MERPAEVKVLRQHDAVTVDNCHREAIHIPGFVQDYGALLALDAELVIRHVSVNIQKFLGHTWENVINKPIAALIDGFLATYTNLQTFEVERTTTFTHYAATGICIDGTRKPVLLYCHLSGPWMIVELQLADDLNVPFAQNRLPQLMRSIHSFRNNSYSVLNVVAQEIFEVSGYDRVLVYEFDDEWNGCVAIEKTRTSQSFLGLHFPSSDIPAQARLLYTKNRIRVIPNVSYTAQPILPAANPPLDLTFANFRSVSPMHIKYLKNMDVAASLSISLLVGSAPNLWGLICLHHPTPREISLQTLTYLHLLGKIASAQIEAIIQREALQLSLTADLNIRSFKDKLKVEENKSLLDIIDSSHGELLSLFDADGLVFENEGTKLYRGMVGKSCEAIAAWLKIHMPATIYSSHTITLDTNIPCEDGLGCGLLSIPLLPFNSRLIFLRSEFAREVEWSGMPTKVDNNGVLNPRASFASWRELRKGFSVPWKEFLLKAAERLQDVLCTYLQNRAAMALQREAAQQQAMAEMLLRRKEIALLKLLAFATPSDTPAQQTVRKKNALVTLLIDNEEYSNSTAKEPASHSSTLYSILDYVLGLANFNQAIATAPFDLSDRLDHILVTLIPLAIFRLCPLLLLSTVHLPAVITADASHLSQILLNLLTSLLMKAPPNVPVTLYVTVHSTKDQRSTLRFKATSFAETVAAREEEKMFYACSRLAAAMGGTLVKEAQQAFVVQIPFGSQTIEMNKLSICESSFSEIACDWPAKFVLVDDREWVREAIRFYLEQWHIEVICCVYEKLLDTLNAEGSAVQWLCTSVDLTPEIFGDLAAKFPTVLLVFFNSVRSHTKHPGFDDVIDLPLLLSQLHRVLSSRKVIRTSINSRWTVFSETKRKWTND